MDIQAVAIIALGASLLLLSLAPTRAAPLLSPNEMVLGWRITAVETRATEAERRLEVYSVRQAAFAEQLETLKQANERQETRLANIEKRVGEVEWRGMSERLVRLESSAEQSRMLLNAIVLAVIAQIIGTVWKVITDRKNGNGNGKKT